MRHQGISMVVDSLIASARAMGLKGVYAHTKDEGILRRANALGFVHVPEIIIALPLTKF
jgi:N-acetylglutamate synthase-like GNAT family acetyltransferase